MLPAISPSPAAAVAAKDMQASVYYFISPIARKEFEVLTHLICASSPFFAYSLCLLYCLAIFTSWAILAICVIVAVLFFNRVIKATPTIVEEAFIVHL